jgi:ParB family chromosome partitioning protein
MARKNLLANLTGPELPAGNSSDSSPQSLAETLAHFSAGRGAIGAVTRSIEQIKSHAIIDLAPAMIDGSFIEDRLEISPEEQATLTASIREHGQQVPILVRPHPSQTGRYQIAYGRRRLRAAAELGRQVRAVVKPLTDEQLVVAQGQENNERKDLSFIEKAIFAAQLEARGFGRETIMAAMCVDKTGLSRLISSAVKVPHDIIVAIGPAPKAGRDRWIELSKMMERPNALNNARIEIGTDSFKAKSSDERFNSVLRATTTKPPRAPNPAYLKSVDGKKFAQVKQDRDRLTVVIDKKCDGNFAAYLVEALPEIYAGFKLRADV